MIQHPIPPLFDENSKILILGSFPSVKSREQGFFYSHPQNRFWQVLASVLQQPIPASIEEKKAFLLQNNIAVWDVIAPAPLPEAPIVLLKMRYQTICFRFYPAAVSAGSL